VTVWGELRNRNVRDWPFSPPDYRDLRQQSTELFEDMAGFIPAGRTPISDTGAEPEQIRVGGATPNFFRVLGARVQLGRDFIDDDARRSRSRRPGTAGAGRRRSAAAARHRDHQPLALDAALRRRPDVIDKDVDLGGGRAHIVGVLAPDFEVLFPPRANVERLTDMWTAARFNFETANRNNVAFRVVGRLKPGVTVQQRRRSSIAWRPTCASSFRSRRRRASISTPSRCSSIWSAMSGRRFCR
jgi:putative ABC transport system permease protein